MISGFILAKPAWFKSVQRPTLNFLNTLIGHRNEKTISSWHGIASFDWHLVNRSGTSYLGGTTATNDYIRIPQYGSFSNGTPFTGNAIASSYQKTINHQFSLIPYFGHSFERGTLYLGVGPTLSQVDTKINNLVGFADLNGVRTDVSGTPQNFSASQWVWGGALVLGGTYYIDKSWFLDLSYTVSMTQNKTASYYSTFNNPSSPNTYSGSLIGSSTGTATTQSIMLTINRQF